MEQVKAHFDGKVFVPDEPVECPKDTPLRLTVQREEDRPLMELVRAAGEVPDDPDWPADGAREHDHYLYGAPKQHP